jgi:hypothetical protein
VTAQDALIDEMAARTSDHTVVLRHRNGGTTTHHGLTLDEARDLASRSIQRRRAAAATITNGAGHVVGYAESAA